MKTIKEIQEEPFQEQSLINDNSKISESLQKENNPENQILTMASNLNQLSLRSDSSKSIKKEDNNNISSSKEKEEKINPIEKEKSNEPENESKKIQKKNLTLSSIIINDNNTNINKIINNNQIRTPLRQDSAPFNYKQKTKVNFQEKLNMGNNSGSEFKSHRNSISMRSPIYSYFDESQKFLSEQYSEENLFKTGQINRKKISSNKEIPNKIENSSNSESKTLTQPN